MSKNSIKDLTTGIQLNIPTDTICRKSSKYLSSILNILPEDVKILVKKYPYMSALCFSLGADSVTWINNVRRGGEFLLSEIRNANHRDKGFPIYEIVESRIYAKELSLLAELGFYYEVDYLRANGFDVSEYDHFIPEDCIKHNEVLFSKPEKSFPGRIDKDKIATMYFHTKEDVEMLVDGNVHVPELLSEKLLILKEILDEHGVCYDGRLITKFDFLPGNINIQLVLQVVECHIPEERFND